jgi:hypothetical protein
MPPDWSHVTDLIHQLASEADCISFYEALTLVRELRGDNEVPKPLLEGLLAVHDDPRTTLGARDVLREFFRAYGGRAVAQRTLAARPLTLRDAGKTVRAAAGSTLVIALEERRAAGFQWQITALSPAAAYARRHDPAAHTARAVFEIDLLAVGGVHLVAVEALALHNPRRRTQPALEERSFDLQIIVEEPAQP